MWQNIFTVIKEFILNVAKKARPAIEGYILDMAKKAIPALEAVIIEEIKRLLENAEEFLKGETFTEAKITLVDKAFEKIDLPIVLKPFKGIIKKVVRSKIDSTLERLLQDLKHKLAEKAN